MIHKKIDLNLLHCVIFDRTLVNKIFLQNIIADIVYDRIAKQWYIGIV